MLPNTFYESNFVLFYLTGVFFLSGLLTNFIQLITFVCVWPFSRKLFRKINYYLNYTVWSQVLFFAEWWSGSDFRVFADSEARRLGGKGHGVVIMNHTYEVDWIMSWMLADRVRLLGNCKAFVKKMIQYVPVIGWCWYFAEMVFLQRNWEDDRKVIRQQLCQFTQYEDPVLLLLFCEGTRFTKEKHNQSMKIARSKGLPELKHHLLPRTRGFVLSVQQLRGKFPAVYDVTVGFHREKSAEPVLMNMLRGKKILGDMYIRRFDLASIPQEEEACGQWLHNLYQEKDRLLDSYITTGSFSEASGFPCHTPTVLSRRWCSLLNFLTWAVIVSTIISYCLFTVLASNPIIIACSAFLVIVAGLIGLNKMVGLTAVTKASTYGSANGPASNKLT